MVTAEDVKAYLDKMSGTDAYAALTDADKGKAIFSATEALLDRYDGEQITPRAAALQTLYMLEGDSEEFAMMKRQGVKSMSVKGVSVTFDGTDIAPAVVRIIEGDSGAMTGRLI